MPQMGAGEPLSHSSRAFTLLVDQREHSLWVESKKTGRRARRRPVVRLEGDVVAESLGRSVHRRPGQSPAGRHAVAVPVHLVEELHAPAGDQEDLGEKRSASSSSFFQRLVWSLPAT